MSELTAALEKCPQNWVEMADLEKLSFEKSTWIPIATAKTIVTQGKYGLTGYRKSYQNIESVIVPLSLKHKFKKKDWQSIVRHCPDTAWADQKKFITPGCYDENERVRYPVIQRWFDTGEPSEWDLFQELEVGLRLLRQNDIWISPEENYVIVAKLERDESGRPEVLLIRAEHLRDYLCARKASLMLALFEYRDAIEENFSGLTWKTDLVERVFAHGKWEGQHSAIHEGGGGYDLKTTVFHAWRESVNPGDDTPEMPHPSDDVGMKSKSFTVKASGRKLYFLRSRIWLKYWISPASQSPRIRRDEVEARIPFQVENQEQRTLAGKALKEYRGWLWFKPSVIRHILNGPKSRIRWFTEDTGEIGSALNIMLHFGINKLGLINVLGYDMADLPEWAQKIWVTHNIGPDGGLSGELHMSQNLAKRAETKSPEAILWHNLQILQNKTIVLYGQSLLQKLPSENEFFRMIHRFYCDSFEDVCELSKELYRIICEPIDLDLLNSKIDPRNAKKSNEKGLRQIKRLAMWLDGLKYNGRKITQPLAGIADLRQGDAHIASSTLRKSLGLFNLPEEFSDYQRMCSIIIGSTANCIAEVIRAVPKNRK